MERAMTGDDCSCSREFAFGCLQSTRAFPLFVSELRLLVGYCGAAVVECEFGQAQWNGSVRCVCVQWTTRESNRDSKSCVGLCRRCNSSLPPAMQRTAALAFATIHRRSSRPSQARSLGVTEKLRFDQETWDSATFCRISKDSFTGPNGDTTCSSRTVSENRRLFCLSQSWIWIGSIHELNCIGWDDSLLYSRQNVHYVLLVIIASQFGAVSFNYDLWTCNCPGFTAIKSQHYKS